MAQKVIFTILALITTMSAAAQPGASGCDALPAHTWSVYAQGGVSFATGGKLMPNHQAARGMGLNGEVGVGANYNLQPWLRLGLDYAFSKYQREQRFSELQQGGMAYCRVSKMYHAVDATIELNLLELWKGKRNKQWSLYLGTGLGWMFAYGPTYTISMGASETTGTLANTDNYTLNAWLQAANERSYQASCMIPCNVSLEYELMPQLTLGLKLQADKLLCSGSTLPSMLETGALTVRVNFVNAGLRKKTE